MNYVVVDLGYGDAGKGTTVDRLCATRPIHTVVRYNGGAQAAHHVVRPDGQVHRFQQFGSGTFHGARTHLSEHMLLEPMRLIHEAAALTKYGIDLPFDLLSVSPKAKIITPYHALYTRLAEVENGHGSTGVGISGVRQFAVDNPDSYQLITWDLMDQAKTEEILSEQRSWIFETFGRIGERWQKLLEIPTPNELAWEYRMMATAYSYLDDSELPWDKDMVFEGSQGVLLDQLYGSHPYTTWSDTTPLQAFDLMPAGADRHVIGVVRSYATRHGAGPLVTEDKAHRIDEPHNNHERWTGEFRTGHFDSVALRYALNVCDLVGCTVRSLALTHIDALRPDWKVCVGYTHKGGVANSYGFIPTTLEESEMRTRMLEEASPTYTEAFNSPNFLAEQWVELVQDWSTLRATDDKTPVGMISSGPTWEDKIELSPLPDHTPAPSYWK